jgi:hypothetical protein
MVVMSRYCLVLRMYKCLLVFVLYLKAKLPPPTLIIGEVVTERYISLA